MTDLQTVKSNISNNDRPSKTLRLNIETYQKGDREGTEGLTEGVTAKPPNINRIGQVFH